MGSEFQSVSDTEEDSLCVCRQIPILRKSSQRPNMNSSGQQLQPPPPTAGPPTDPLNQTSKRSNCSKLCEDADRHEDIPPPAEAAPLPPPASRHSSRASSRRRREGQNQHSSPPAVPPLPPVPPPGQRSHHEGSRRSSRRHQNDQTLAQPISPEHLVEDFANIDLNNPGAVPPSNNRPPSDRGPPSQFSASQSSYPDSVHSKRFPGGDWRRRGTDWRPKRASDKRKQPDPNERYWFRPVKKGRDALAEIQKREKAREVTRKATSVWAYTSGYGKDSEDRKHVSTSLVHGHKIPKLNGPGGWSGNGTSSRR